MIVERDSCLKVANVQSGPKGVRSYRRSGDNCVGIGEACGLIREETMQIMSRQMVSSTIVNPSNMFRHQYNIVMGRAVARSSQLVRPDLTLSIM